MIHGGRLPIHAPITTPVQLPVRQYRAVPISHTEFTMSSNNENEIVRIDLTADQKAKLKESTDKSVEAIELTVQELESRIAPVRLY